MEIAIVGTGISAATLYDQLKDIANITLFEKNSNMGGRMRSLQIDEHHFDIGVQDFTIKSKLVGEYVKPWLKQKLLFPWKPKLQLLDNHNPQNLNLDEPHYIVQGAMVNLVKTLLKEAVIYFNCPIRDIKKQNNLHQLRSYSGDTFGPFDWVISTMPAPLSRELMPPFQSLLRKIQTLPRAVLLLGYKGYIDIEDVTLVTDSDINWIIANHRKPTYQGQTALVVQSTPPFMLANSNKQKEQINNKLYNSFQRHFHFKETPTVNHIILWSYAHIKKTITENYLIDTKKRIAVCGDGLVDGRVEGAITSALELAAALKQR